MILTVHYDNYDLRRPYTAYDENNNIIFIFRLLINNPEQTDLIIIDPDIIPHEIIDSLVKADFQSTTTLISNLLHHGHLIDWSHVPESKLPKELRQ